MQLSCRPAVTFSVLLALAMCCQAQQAPQSSKSVSSKPAKASLQTREVDQGAIANGVYRNAPLGLSYKLPYGWVDRTQKMSEDSGETGKPDAAQSDSAKSKLLLSTFERPPEATGNTVNSGVVIAAENVSSYPGLKDAAQYFGPLGELTTAKGFKPINHPYDFPVDGKPIVRGDFSKKLGNVTMHQSTLVMLDSGYVISFTFIGGSEEEVNGLVEGLSFGRKETRVVHKVVHK